MSHSSYISFLSCNFAFTFFFQNGRQREAILKLILENENVSINFFKVMHFVLEPHVDRVELITLINLSRVCLSVLFLQCFDCFILIQVESAVDLCKIAQDTDGFSGSDLREMCRDAALLCVRDCMHSSNSASAEGIDR